MKANLHKSFELRNLRELRRHAHSLKGACGYICSEQLKNSALELQLVCDAINEGTSPMDEALIVKHLHQVTTEIDTVVTAINAHIAELPAEEK